MMNIDQNSSKKPRKNSSSSSLASSTSISNPTTTSYSSISTENHGSNMYLELEFLKSKISMLEHLISGAQSNEQSPLNAQSPGHPSWNNPSGNPSDLDFMIANNPCLSDSQYFSFHNLYNPFVTMSAMSARHYYPLSWVSLIKLYSAVSPLFAMKHKKNMKDRRVIMATDKEPTSPSERVFNKKLREFVGEEGIYKPDKLSRDDTKEEKLRKINQRAKTVGLTVFEGDLDSVADVLEKATLLLPTRKVIWLLIDRFFERVYPFFPFLDQMEFEAQVALLLGSSSAEHVRVEKLNIVKKIEVIHVGTLLLVLRFAYLTLFTNDDSRNEANLYSNDPSPKAQQLKFLLDNPIDVDVFSVSQLCLFQFGYLRYANIPILQLCLYLKVYNSFAPENGEGADDSNSQGFCARIIDMAMTLGLHREPDNYRSKVRDDRLNNLCRKIWWYLVITDITSGLTNGSHIAIKRSHFDTLPPYHKPGNENIRDVSLEKRAILALANFDQCYDIIYNVVSVISDVRAPIPMREFCHKISILEGRVHQQVGSILNSFNFEKGQVSHIEIENGLLLKIGFEATFFLVSVYMHFYNHYEKMGQMDLAYYYLKKLIYLSVYKMMPFYDKFVDTTAEIFLNTTDLAITPSFQTLVHKCTIIIHCVLMRSRFSILKCENLPTHDQDLMTDLDYGRRYGLLKQTFALCDVCLKIFLRSMKKMTSRYYYCWRYIKAQEKLEIIRNGTEYYMSWCKGKESYMLLDSDMLSDLVGILKKSIKLVPKTEFEEEPVPVPLSTYAPNCPEFNPVATPTNNFPMFQLNDQFSDAMWTLMLEMKPDMGKTGIYSETPPMSFPVDYMNMGPAYDPNQFNEFNNMGEGFYDSLFGDIMNQGANF